MQFQEFKEELIQRVENKNASEEELEKLFDANDFSEALGFVKNNFRSCIIHEVISIDFLKKIDSDILDKHEIFINKSSDKGYILCDNEEVEAKGDVIVFARGDSRVTAFDNVKVSAMDNTKVLARDFSKVEALDYSEVEAWDNSRIKAFNNSKVEALNDSKVEALDQSEVKAIDYALVEAFNGSEVEAMGNAYLLSFNGTNHILKDSAIMRHEGVIYFPKDLKFKQI